MRNCFVSLPPHGAKITLGHSIDFDVPNSIFLVLIRVNLQLFS